MRLTAAALAVAAACLLAEGLLRVVWDRPASPHVMQLFDGKTYYRPDPEFGQLPRPNVAGVHPGFDAPFTTNSRGLRGRREFVVPKPAGVTRVVVLGDSFAWGYGVADDEIFTAELQRRFPRTEVVNLGVISFDLRGDLAYFEREGTRYEPDVVLVALCQNDIRDHSASPAPRAVDIGHPSSAVTAPKSGPKEEPRPGVVARFRPVKQFLNDHSDLFALTAQAVNASKTLTGAAVSLGLKEDYAGFDMLDDNLHAALIEYPPQVDRAMSGLEEDLLRLKQSVEARGARLIVALIPSLQAVNPDALAASIAYTKYDADEFDMDKPYQRIAAFAREHGIPVCSPLASFQKRFGRGATLYLPRDMHFNPAGHRAFAEAVAPLLEETLSAIRSNAAARAAKSDARLVRIAR